MPAIQTMKETIKENKISIETLRRVRNDINSTMIKKQTDIKRLQLVIITHETNKYAGKTIIIGNHECKKSPIGICFYDDYNDPCCDNCLICGEPDERK